MLSYIGVTGFTTATQVAAALNAMASMHFAVQRTQRKLMVGVLASARSLRGAPLRPVWQDRYPRPTAIAGIFPDDPRTLNLVHFAPGDEYRASLLPDLDRLTQLAGPRLHGFQLNMAWPRETELGVYREDCGYRRHVIVLQLGAAALGAYDGDAAAVAKRVRGYGALIDAVLVDGSGGRGEPLDVDVTRRYVSEIVSACPALGVGVAGGLDAEGVGRIAALREEFPFLSIDAEGRLRTAQGLDDAAVQAYLARAYHALDRIPYALPA